MARTRTLAELRADARKYADQEVATQRFPDAEVNRYVNEGIAACYDLLVEVYGNDYYGTSTTFSTVNGTRAYALPADFYKLHVLFRSTGSTENVPLEPASTTDEVWLRNIKGVYPTHYRLRAGYVDLYPIPGGVFTIENHYVPCVAVLSSDAATFDGINGWEEYPAVMAARTMATKDEDFELVAALSARLAELTERIRRMAPARDAGRAPRVKDTRWSQYSRRWAQWR